VSNTPSHQRIQQQPVSASPSYLVPAVSDEIARIAGKAGAEAAQGVAISALARATNRLEIAHERAEAAHRRAVPDTLVADVPGLEFGTFKPPAAAWPLVDALAKPWATGRPLVWLVESPTVEVPALEKAQLTGTTIKVAADMGTPVDVAAYTDVSLQAAVSPSVVETINGLLTAAVAADVDRRIATALAAAAGTPVATVGDALAAVAAWPGGRLIVIAPTALGDAEALVAYVDMSGGAVRVICDPYVDSSLVLAVAGVAVGVAGPERLAANRPSHLGVDTAVTATVAIEAAAGAVATWPTPTP
jgi:hypothetical protein